MATQDRNMHRDADSSVQTITAQIPAAPAATDVDEPFWWMQPRFNYRLKDTHLFATSVATADAIIRATVTPTLSAMGAVAASAAAAATFAMEAFWQNVAGVPTSIAADAAVAFTTPFTVVDGGWGVFICQVDAAGTVTTKAPSATMGYATEALALGATPKPDPLNGHVCTVTIEAVGADFVAGTDDTNTAATFISRGREGTRGTLAINTEGQDVQALRESSTHDRAGVSMLNGRAVGALDLLALTIRSAGVPVVTGGQAHVQIRPFPAQGEGLQSASASQTGPFVP